MRGSVLTPSPAGVPGLLQGRSSRAGNAAESLLDEAAREGLLEWGMFPPETWKAQEPGTLVLASVMSEGQREPGGQRRGGPGVRRGARWSQAADPAISGACGRPAGEQTLEGPCRQAQAPGSTCSFELSGPGRRRFPSSKSAASRFKGQARLSSTCTSPGGWPRGSDARVTKRQGRQTLL